MKIWNMQRQGEDFDIDVNMPAYKYYRVEVLETWADYSCASWSSDVGTGRLLNF